MASLKVLTVALLAVAAVSASPTRIAGGESTAIENYPSVVQVEFFNTFTQAWAQSCVATLNNSRYLLSSAQCFDGWNFSMAWRRFRAGSALRNTGGEVRNLAYVEEYYTYRPPHYDGDLVIVVTNQPFEFSSVIQAAGIPPLGFEVPDGASVVQVGWGSSAINGPIATELQALELNTINREECRERYQGVAASLSVVTENMICSGSEGKATCDDLGAPLFYNNVLVGVASWGQYCDPEYPGVSTRVSSYSDWIVDFAPLIRVGA